MKSIYKNLFLGLCVGTIFLTSCSEDEDTRTKYSHSTPVIESASINPSSFVYGDSVTVTAKVSDKVTPLSTLKLRMIVNDVLVAETEVRTPGNSSEVSTKFKVNYAAQLPNEADVEVQLTLINVEGDETKGSIEGLKGKRTYYKKLYLVLDDGKVYPLTPKSDKSDKYFSEKVIIKNSKIKYRIAEKITDENQIDFSGHVWGYVGGSIQLVDETGDYITTASTLIDYVTEIEFDNYDFKTTLQGEKIKPNVLILDYFDEIIVENEKFMKLSRSIEKDQIMTLFGDLASTDVVYNMDYFERISDDQVKFVGPEGSYSLYYSPTRKTMIVDPDKRSYPDVLLAAGVGLGYPSKVKPEAHTDWNFDAPLRAIVFRKINTDIYQGTVYIDAETLNFKFYENKDWGNEKKSTDYTISSVIAKDSDLGKTDGNWYAATGATSGNYRVTINLATKVVTVDSVTLP